MSAVGPIQVDKLTAGRTLTVGHSGGIFGSCKGGRSDPGNIVAVSPIVSTLDKTLQ